jgi:hypothetical protein
MNTLHEAAQAHGGTEISHTHETPLVGVRGRDMGCGTVSAVCRIHDYQESGTNDRIGLRNTLFSISGSYLHLDFCVGTFIPQLCLRTIAPQDQTLLQACSPEDPPRRVLKRR